MRTGVTHQLRVHMAHLGHPIVGDRRYGAPSRGAHADVDTDVATNVSDADPAAGAIVVVADDARHGDWHYHHACRIDGEHDELPRMPATSFPPHWRPLFERLGWPTGVPDPW